MCGIETKAALSVFPDVKAFAECFVLAVIALVCSCGFLGYGAV